MDVIYLDRFVKIKVLGHAIWRFWIAVIAVVK